VKIKIQAYWELEVDPASFHEGTDPCAFTKMQLETGELTWDDLDTIGSFLQIEVTEVDPERPATTSSNCLYCGKEVEVIEGKWYTDHARRGEFDHNCEGSGASIA
jgi:hypothetical protein